MTNPPVGRNLFYSSERKGVKGKEGFIVAHRIFYSSTLLALATADIHSQNFSVGIKYLISDYKTTDDEQSPWRKKGANLRKTCGKLDSFTSKLELLSPKDSSKDRRVEEWNSIERRGTTAHLFRSSPWTDELAIMVARARPLLSLAPGRGR